ncbi:peptidoglycan-binding domain-containing protein [Streptomyces sp. NPDC054933]
MVRTQVFVVALISAVALGSAGTLTTANAATSPAVASASTCAQSRPLLSQGDQGGCVAFLQRTLSNNGFSTKPDGIFGPKTTVSVEAFQYACGFRGSEVDGIVGPQTWAGLLDHSCV